MLLPTCLAAIIPAAVSCIQFAWDHIFISYLLDQHIWVDSIADWMQDCVLKISSGSSCADNMLLLYFS